MTMFKKITFKTSLLGIFMALMMQSPAHSAPAKGMRYKALADVMDDYMRTKDAAWLVANIGEPDAKDTQYKGYTVWRWNSAYRLSGVSRKNKTPCQQIFIIENGSEKISGWQTDCAPNINAEMYGEIAEATPIPKAVIPESMLGKH